ncbi:unnamed protein product [Coregonus sp. 'balchen']|nr:unnamed protein product [Coregonus sp. 'balchen']
MAHKSEDLFDCILMADDRFHGEGYREGFDEGTRQGMIDGRFLLLWIWNHLEMPSSKQHRCEVQFPHEEPHYENLQEDMEKVRAKFRQVCSLLNVPTDFSDYVKTGGSGGISF